MIDVKVPNIIDIKYVNDLPANRTYDFFYEDPDMNYWKRIQEDPNLDVSVLYRMNGSIYVAYIDIHAKSIKEDTTYESM